MHGSPTLPANGSAHESGYADKSKCPTGISDQLGRSKRHGYISSQLKNALRKPLNLPRVTNQFTLRMPKQVQAKRTAVDTYMMRGTYAAVPTSDASNVLDDDTNVDFASAGLYLLGIQAVGSIVTCSIVSILSCWLTVDGTVSAVRTLALCVAGGALLMRKPLRVGRARGTAVIFAALQPVVCIYLLALVLEQLLHTCTTDSSAVPSWRRVLFHFGVLAMAVSGMLRAKNPTQDTDLPFLITLFALLVVAIAPPPAVALAGPLCSSVGLVDAAERTLRAFIFAFLYAAHVYASTTRHSASTNDTIVVVARSASASVWTLGAVIYLFPLAVVQCVVLVRSRILLEPLFDVEDPLLEKKVESQQPTKYQTLPQQQPPSPPTHMIHEDTPQNHTNSVAVAEIAAPEPLPAVPTPSAAPAPLPTIGPLSFRELTASSASTNGTAMSKERMAAIASALNTSESIV